MMSHYACNFYCEKCGRIRCICPQDLKKLSLKQVEKSFEKTVLKVLQKKDTP